MAIAVKCLRKENPIVRAFLWHFGNTTSTITQPQFEKEKHLIWNIKFNPWILMPAAFIVQFCCGSVYAWSVFNTPIDEAITGNGQASQAPVTFYIAIGMLGFSAATMGPWLERNGPKKALILSSCSFFVGNLIAALAIYIKSMWLLYIGYGVIGGFGIGVSYISPVSPLQKWFPHRRGMAAGFAVCGFGAGSIGIGKLILPLIHCVGLPLTFVVLGTSFFLAMMCAAFLFRIPPPDYSVSTDDKTETTSIQPEIELSLIQSIKSIDYSLLYVMLFANILFGLVVISRLSNIITQLYLKDPEEAATIVSINGGMNLLGRLLFSSISDKIGRKSCFIIMLMTQTIVVATFPLYTEHRVYWAFLVCMFALTLCYGGGFGVIPAFLADMFGSKNIGACHGVILTAWSIAGVGGGLAFTMIYNNQIAHHNWTTGDAYPYIINSYWILFFVLAGLLSAVSVRTNIRDRVLPPDEGQWFRFRLCGSVALIKKVKNYPEVEFVSAADYELKWEQYLKSCSDYSNSCTQK